MKNAKNYDQLYTVDHLENLPVWKYDTLQILSATRRLIEEGDHPPVFFFSFGQSPKPFFQDVVDPHLQIIHRPEHTPIVRLVIREPTKQKLGLGDLYRVGVYIAQGSLEMMDEYLTEVGEVLFHQTWDE